MLGYCSSSSCHHSSFVRFTSPMSRRPGKTANEVNGTSLITSDRHLQLLGRFALQMINFQVDRNHRDFCQSMVDVTKFSNCDSDPLAVAMFESAELIYHLFQSAEVFAQAAHHLSFCFHNVIRRGHEFPCPDCCAFRAKFVKSQSKHSLETVIVALIEYLPYKRSERVAPRYSPMISFVTYLNEHACSLPAAYSAPLIRWLQVHQVAVPDEAPQVIQHVITPLSSLVPFETGSVTDSTTSSGSSMKDSPTNSVGAAHSSHSTSTSTNVASEVSSPPNTANASSSTNDAVSAQNDATDTDVLEAHLNELASDGATEVHCHECGSTRTYPADQVLCKVCKHPIGIRSALPSGVSSAAVLSTSVDLATLTQLLAEERAASNVALTQKLAEERAASDATLTQKLAEERTTSDARFKSMESLHQSSIKELKTEHQTSIQKLKSHRVVDRNMISGFAAECKALKLLRTADQDLIKRLLAECKAMKLLEITNASKIKRLEHENEETKELLSSVHMTIFLIQLADIMQSIIRLELSNLKEPVIVAPNQTVLSVSQKNIDLLPAQAQALFNILKSISEPRNAVAHPNQLEVALAKWHFVGNSGNPRIVSQSINILFCHLRGALLNNNFEELFSYFSVGETARSLSLRGLEIIISYSDKNADFQAIARNDLSADNLSMFQAMHHN